MKETSFASPRHIDQARKGVPLVAHSGNIIATLTAAVSLALIAGVLLLFMYMAMS